MAWHNKVVWTEGMFLQPQHFQQHDRYLEHLTDARVAASFPYGWGFLSVAVDEGALAFGKVAVSAARGVLPDGTLFEIPGEDPAPLTLDVPPDARDELVVLALPLSRPGVLESDAEGPSGAGPTRFNVAEVSLPDSNAASGRDAVVQIGRLGLRLLLARDAQDAFVAVGVARVVERRADNRVVLDLQYVPPLLDVIANPVLGAAVRELHGLLRQRADALAARLAQPGRAGVGEISDFLLLEALNRAEPAIAHMARRSLLHPEALYACLVALAGELATFREPRRPPAFADYRHDDLAASFRPVIDELRRALSTVMEQTAIPIELQDRKYGVRVALIPDIEMQRNASFVLAVDAQMPGDALRARFPTQIKIGPVERIRDLVNLQLPGVALRPLPVAPRQIPYHAGFNYFELETRQSDLWKQLETSGGLAMHVAGEFPGLELEFWAIRA